MSRFRSRLVLLAAALSIVSGACKKEPPPAPPEPPKTEEPKGEAPKAEEPPAAASPTAAPAEASPAAAPAAASPTAAPDAASVLTPGSKFMFALADSPDAMALHKKGCDEEAKGDADKAKACMDKVAAQGANEGIRLEKEGDQWVFVSFGKKDDGSEELFIKGPVAKVDSPAHEFKFKAAGPAAGVQALKMGLDKFDPAKADAMIMTIEVVDATTVAMPAPPPKGRLVYKKAQ
ncbi:MAG: hypothetical protein FJ100_05505 [Deltaproteobacteria bacterium]|nr:hypothetical protein [Deltaproteobacteria bacterium]